MEQSESASTANKTKRILKIVTNVLAYVFVALCVGLLIFTITSKRSEDGAVAIFGREMRIVVSGSMEENPETDVSQFKIKSIPVKSVIFVKRVPKDKAKAEEWYKSLQKGDVLTFRYLESGTVLTITHRIIGIEEKPTGGYIISLRADNGAGSELSWQVQVIDTSEVGSTNYVIGKVTGQSKAFGHLIIFFSKPYGLALIIIVPCLIVIASEGVRIIGTLKKMKSEKDTKQ